MPVFFDPLQTSDRQQWVDGGVRDVTPLGAALELNPTGVLVIRASPASKPASSKCFGALIPIGLRAVNLLQSEVSRNDLANTSLINDMLGARADICWTRSERCLGRRGKQANSTARHAAYQIPLCAGSRD